MKPIERYQKKLNALRLRFFILLSLLCVVVVTTTLLFVSLLRHVHNSSYRLVGLFLFLIFAANVVSKILVRHLRKTL